MNAVIETVIAKVLSPYLEGISRENLRLAIFSGNVRLNDLKVNPAILTELNMHEFVMDSATVASVVVSIPWTNPINGKIVIEVEGVSARVQYAPSTLDRTKLVSIARNLIDEVKKKLMESAKIQAEAADSGWDSFSAKLVRRLINSITVSVKTVDLTLVLPSPRKAVVDTDSEGFADATETQINSGDCDINVAVATLSLEDSEDDSTRGPGILRKRLRLEGCSLSVLPSGRTLDVSDQILPPSSLWMEVHHDLPQSSLRVDILGMDACEIALRRAQLVLLKDVTIGAPSRSPTIKRVGMNEEARANYSTLYKVLQQGGDDAHLDNIRCELADLALLFDPTSIAQCEVLVERELSAEEPSPAEASTPMKRSWFGNFFSTSSPKRATTAEMEQFEASLIQQVEEEAPVGVPSKIRVSVDVGKEWTIRVLHDTQPGETRALMEILLRGVNMVFEGSNRESDGQIEASLHFQSKGLSVTHKTCTLVAFQQVTSKDQVQPADVWVKYFKGGRLAAGELDIAVAVLPVTITYEPGLYLALVEFFAFLNDATVVDNIDLQRERIYQTGLDLLDSVKDSPEYLELARAMAPNSVGITLNLAGPVVVLPAGPATSAKVIVTLGDMTANQPKCVVDGSVDTVPATAVLKRVSVACVTEFGESVQMMSPTQMGISAFLNSAEKALEVAVNLDGVLSCRVSPQAVRVVRTALEFAISELAAVEQAQPIVVKRGSSFASLDSVKELTDGLESPESPIERVANRKIRVVANIAKIDAMVSDGSTDCLNLQLALPSISLGIDLEAKQTIVSCDDIRLMARSMNARLGDWEPLIEPSFYSATLKVTEEQLLVQLRALRGGMGVVLTSDSIKQVASLADLLIAPPSARLTDRYRVVNATDTPMYLCVPGVTAKCTLVALSPSDEFVAIDDAVLPHGVREVVVSADRDLLIASSAAFPDASDGMFGSMLRIPLDRLHSALLTTGGQQDADAAILVHSQMGTDYRCILFSRSATMYNHCDVPVELSFSHDVRVPTPPVELLGMCAMKSRSRMTVLKKSDWINSSLLLNPGSFVSVPFAILSSFSMRPVTGGSRPWSQPVTLTADLFCRCETPPTPGESQTPKSPPPVVDTRVGYSPISVEAGGFLLRIDTCKSVSELPLAAAVYEVHIRPPLAVRNNTPTTLRLRHSISAAKPLVVVTLPAWDTVAVYSCVPVDEVRSFTPSIAFLPLASEWSDPIGSDEARFELSPDPGSVHPVHLTALVRNSYEITVAVKWWIIDRTGLNLTLCSADTHLPLPQGDDNSRVWLLPDPDTPSNISVHRGGEYCDLAVPDSGWVTGWIGRTPLVFVSRETMRDKYVEILPKFSIFNALKERVYLTFGTGEPVVELLPQMGMPVVRDSFTFSIDSPDAPPSASIPLKDSTVGVWPIHVDGRGRVCRVEIASANGTINVTIRPGSSIVIRNEKRSKPATLFVDKGYAFTVPALSERAVGWTDPFTDPVSEGTMQIGNHKFLVPLAKAGEEKRYGGCVKIIPGRGSQSIVMIVEHRPDSNEETPAGRARQIRVEFNAASIGMSLVRNGTELIYAELSLIRALLQQDEFTRRTSLLVSEIQVDTSVSPRKPVVLVNTGEGLNPFLEASVATAVNVSSGVAVVPAVTVQFDSLFVEVDSAFMAALEDWLDDMLGGSDTGRTGQHTHALMEQLTSLVKGTIRPVPVPVILILDSLDISALSVQLWVDLSLKSMVLMPASLKLIIGVLSLGGSFKLDGPVVTFRRRTISGFKGSSVQFAQGILHEYIMEALRNMASLLGSSSLLTIPRAPIQLVTGVGAFGLERATQAVGGLGGFVAGLASDPKYRDAQERIRRTKKIQGVADGFVEGANRLGEGAEGLLDIFKKPIHGARNEGVGGFFRGIGTGLVGTVLKPITKVGEAIQDIGTGIARSVAPSKRGKASRYARKRYPRAFYGKEQAVMDYRAVDAYIYSKLPVGMELVIPLLSTEGEMQYLVGFKERIVIVGLTTSATASPAESDTSPAVSTASYAVSTTIQTGEFASLVILREIFARQMRKVNVSIATKSVNIEDIMGIKTQLFVDLPPSDSAGALLEALSSTFTTTAIAKGQLDWREPKRVFQELDFTDASRDDVSKTTAADGTVAMQVDVYEVERFLMAVGWRTPFLMLDTQTGWRWVDVNMTRQTKIRPHLKRSEAAKARTPPIDLGDLWTPLDDWKVYVDVATTDKDGWQYAISFNSSTWARSPGITASVRKRKWIRHFS